MITMYYVDKETGTPADTSVAFGLLDLLDRVIPQEVGDIGLRIEDRGECYRIALKTAVQPEWIGQCQFFAILPGLDTKTKKSAVPYRIDYLHHQEKNTAFFEAVSKGLAEEELANQGLTQPHTDWPVWAVINQMSATDAYNKLTELWYAHKDFFPSLLHIILQMYSQHPNPVETGIAEWTKLAKQQDMKDLADFPQLQVVNPGMGKGGNRSKANGLGIGGLSGFWLVEYLKFAGFYQAALPRVVKGAKDRKTYVLRPKNLLWQTHKDVFPKFQKAMYAQTAVKMDSLAVLSYCQTFLEQWKAGQESTFRHLRGNPGNHVAAIETIYYKHLGSAHATMNLSTLVLPLWLKNDIETNKEAQQFIELLEEHRRVVYRLDEKKGDEYNLLHDYRNFLSSHNLRPFYEFMRGYSKHIMSELAKGTTPPQFTIPNLEVLIMANDPEQKLTPILQDEGFRNVAEAIRRSTVIPQGQKARGRDTLYEIRYGLGDKLLRHAQYPTEFIQELGRFMHDYNRENAQKLETRKQQFRSNLTMTDIEAIALLIDRYDSPTIASLLVAFGYARDPNLGQKESDGETTPQTITETP